MRDRRPAHNGLRRRSRSRSLSPLPRRTLHRDSGDTWRYSRQQQYHGRSPSPVRRSFGRPAPASPSPSPPPFRRDRGYGEYYGDGGGGPSRTLGSPRRRGREDADRDRLPSPPRYGAERGSSYRGRDYGYESYKEEREGYFGKLAGRERVGYDSALSDRAGGVSGVSGVRTVPGDGVGSRGYFGNLVERSSGEYGGGRYVSSSTLRARDDERRLSSGLGSIPVRYPVSTSVAGADTVVGKIGERGAGSSSLFRESWRADGYGSMRERYADVGRVAPLLNRGVDAGYLKQTEVKSVEGEESGFRGNSGGGSSAIDFGGYGDRASRLLARYDGLYATGHRSRVFDDEELVAAQEHSEALLPSKSSFDIETGVHNRKSDWYELDEVGQTRKSVSGDFSDEDLEELPYEENLGSTKFQVRVNARPTDIMSEDDEHVDVGDHDSPGSLSPECLQVPERTFGNPQKHFGGPSKNVKERLGIVPNDIKKRLGGPARNVKQRLGPVQNVKQRLGPVGNAGKSKKLPWKGHKRLPWVEGYERRTTVGVDRSDRPLQADSPVEKYKEPAKIKIEPPEDSEEFKQLVQTSFLKFIKILNENSAYRRRFLEQGGSSSFKCSVCGSSSEFTDLSGLAQHAFQSCKVGFRSEHLGFHRALCVLMGWKCAELPYSSWSRQMLPASEAASLKDDLIIWPPVVFIHNSSIAKGNVDERVVVSIDELRNVLKGMGFGHCMANLCRGKAANQSVMVASFTGTFSGLREAERLHGLYAENQHGRAEFEQTISSSCNSTSQEIQRLFTDKTGIIAIQTCMIAVYLVSKQNRSHVQVTALKAIWMYRIAGLEK